MSPFFDLCPPLSIFKAGNGGLSPSHIVASWPPLLLHFYRPDYIGPSQIIQDNSPISKSLIQLHLQSPFWHVRWHIHNFQFRILSFIINIFATTNMLANLTGKGVYNKTTGHGFIYLEPIQVTLFIIVFENLWCFFLAWSWIQTVKTFTLLAENRSC